MEDLKMYSGKCRTSAMKIHATFDVWQKITMELYACTQNESAQVEAKQQELAEKLAFADSMAKNQELVVADVKKGVDAMNAMVKECKQDYKDQMEQFPGA
jgi:hypothetical protein